MGQDFGSYPNNMAQEQDYESDHGSDDSEAESIGLIEMIRTYPQFFGSVEHAVLKQHEEEVHAHKMELVAQWLGLD